MHMRPPTNVLIAMAPETNDEWVTGEVPATGYRVATGSDMLIQ